MIVNPTNGAAAAEDTMNIDNEANLTIISVVDGIGVGGFASIVLAKIKKEVGDNLVAVKCSPKSRNNNNRRSIRKLHYHIQNEVSYMNNVGCLNSFPFIQHFIESFESINNVFLILEFCQGGDLFYHMNCPPRNITGFTTKEARILLAETFLGIEYIHKNHYIHGDIKVSTYTPATPPIPPYILIYLIFF